MGSVGNNLDRESMATTWNSFTCRRSVLLVGISLAVLAGMLLVAGCTGIPGGAGPFASSLTSPTDLKKFNSTAEIETYLKAAMAESMKESASGERYYMEDGVSAGVVPMAAPMVATSSSKAGTVAGAGSAQHAAESKSADLTVPAPAIAPGFSGPVDYSQTNIQVAGVDEPDIVKNDAKYIYTISGSTLAIIDAYPAGSAAVISKTEIADTPKDLFVNGDRLVLFTTEVRSPEDMEYDVTREGSERSVTREGSERSVTREGSERSVTREGEMIVTPGMSGTDVATSMVKRVPPYRFSTVFTHATVYDIRDRKNPKMMKDYTIEGDYIDSRMIGPLVYMVTREQISSYGYDDIIVPTLREGTRTVVRPDVWYFDHPDSRFTFTTLTALDVVNGNEKAAQTYLLGSGNTLYVSQDAIYVSYQTYFPVVYPVRRWVGGPEPMPAVAGEASGVAVSPKEATASSVAPLPADFNSLPESQRQSILEDLRNAEQDAVKWQEIDQTTTVIHKIAIKDGTITYVAKGEVPGSLHNQFSMDEYRGDLRLATTSRVYSRSGQYTYNNVYVLDGKMATIGTLTHIAEQETIYSTRFIGDRLYMVTFKRIDPFFVIDLSKPEDPKVLGKLKIPGYSDYLHPYDATHIIGIGKETATNDWGGVSTSGVKLALFDVSDVSSPKQVDKVQIGDAGSDSAALSDHHAFLFDKAKDILVIPIRAVSSSPVIKGDMVYPGQQVWYGAYVFGLTPQAGFTLKGTVQHGASDQGRYYYGSSTSEVKRSLYIGNVLYTMSAKQIKANSLDDINTTIATVPLPNVGDIYYPPVMGG